MAVRKIPKNHLFVTGGYSSRKSEEMDGFESLLEKDYLLLLDFDDTVESFEAQPVRILARSRVDLLCFVQKLLQLRNGTQLCLIHIDHHP